MPGQGLLHGLQEGLRQLGEDPAHHPCDAYLAYLDLLGEWNRAYNLTAIRDPERMLSHHLLDSLSILPFIRGDRCLDVGTGAGLPGLILALAGPRRHWVLLDSSAKKIRFLNQVLLELRPANVELVRSRVEDYRPAQLFSTVCTRAFASVLQFQRQAGHLITADGILLAMKGKFPAEEADELQAAGVQCAIRRIAVPALQAERHVVMINNLEQPA